MFIYDAGERHLIDVLYLLRYVLGKIETLLDFRQLKITVKHLFSYVTDIVC